MDRRCPRPLVLLCSHSFRRSSVPQGRWVDRQGPRPMVLLCYPLFTAVFSALLFLGGGGWIAGVRDLWCSCVPRCVLRCCVLRLCSPLCSPGSVEWLPGFATSLAPLSPTVFCILHLCVLRLCSPLCSPGSVEWLPGTTTSGAPVFPAVFSAVFSAAVFPISMFGVDANIIFQN